MTAEVATRYLAIFCLLTAKALGDSERALFKVLRNTLDTADFGTIGGAVLTKSGTVAESLNRSLGAVTICFRFRLKVLGFGLVQRGYLFDIADWQNNPSDPVRRVSRSQAQRLSVFDFGYDDAYSSYLLQNHEGSYSVFAPYLWSHLCYAFKKPGESRLVLNGKPTSVNKVDPVLANLTVPLDVLLKVHLMRCNNDFVKDCTAPGGQITDFNIWDREFTFEEQVNWTTCRLFSTGNIVDWKKAEWRLENMVSEELGSREVCGQSQVDDVLFPEPREHSDLKLLCKAVNGNMSVVTKENQDAIIASYLAFVEDPSGEKVRFWTGWDDIDEEDVYRNGINNEVIVRNGGSGQWWPFYSGKPNGGRMENCAALNVFSGGWNDIDCGKDLLGFCRMPVRLRFKLRGLPEDASLDTQYSIDTDNLVNGHFSLDGYTDSKILHSATTENQWRLEKLSGAGGMATTEAFGYPFGTTTWTLSTPVFNGDIPLSLNACGKDEFNCDNGICVSMDKRCDGRNDCGDASEEAKCNKIEVLDSYQNEVPPLPLKGESIAKVHIGLNVSAIVEISEVNSIFMVQFAMNLRWREAQLSFRNLKEDRFLNTVSTEDAGKIWFPTILFFNTRYKEMTVYDGKSVMTIERQGNATRSSLDELYHNEYYDGGENDINLFHLYTIEFTCEFDMAYYPFDTQKCSMIFVLQGNDGKFAQLVKEHLDYLGPEDLSQYYVQSMSMVDNKTVPLIVTDGTKGVQVDFILSRRLLSHFLTTFLPTGCICIVAFTTNYFQPTNFTPIITVNLTSLLVLTTLFIGISKSLPNTSYVKFIDIWLIFSLLMPFAEVLLHTAADILRNSKKRSALKGERISSAWEKEPPQETGKVKKRVLKFIVSVGKIGIPLLFATFCVCFIAYGMYVKSRAEAGK